MCCVIWSKLCCAVLFGGNLWFSLVCGTRVAGNTSHYITIPSLFIARSVANYQLFAFLLKGVILQSYLILCANIISGFNMWKHIALYFYHKYSLGSQILYCKCVQLYVAFVKIYLITIQTAAQSSVRCVKSASTRCVFN